MLLSYGGTQSIESPGEYSAVAKELIAEIGSTLSVLQGLRSESLREAGHGSFLRQRDVWRRSAADRVLISTPWPEFLAKAPLSDAGAARHRARLHRKSRLPGGLSLEQKQRKLATISYADYLTKFCKVTPEALQFFQSFPHDFVRRGH